ncbi:LppP/LprE family lipoprotein [Corynebacterium frankenforstense]|uniref:LppP/LprE family lipoprotein n=1 Tax=Corynebacterium frankenforstense TaxID=1230998 RepID=UPI0009514781|nr:LppP/LprE family lipoprotein [Corynebacterium frankenforstense]
MRTTSRAGRPADPAVSSRTGRTALCTAALAAALALSACSDGAGEKNDAPVLTTVPDTTAAAPQEDSAGQPASDAAGDGQAQAGPDEADGGSGCGGMSAEEAMYEGLSYAGPNSPEGLPWDTGHADPASTYDPCADLSWIAVRPWGASGTMPTRIMLYHRGEFLGTTTSDNYRTGGVYRDSDSQITVEYVYIRDGEASADASGRTYATFTWNGSETVMTGEVPPA